MMNAKTLLLVFHNIFIEICVVLYMVVKRCHVSVNHAETLHSLYYSSRGVCWKGLSESCCVIAHLSVLYYTTKSIYLISVPFKV